MCSSYAAEIQILLVVIVMICSLMANVKLLPQIYKKFQKLELYSQGINLLFIYIGMFYVSGSHYEYIKCDEHDG